MKTATITDVETEVLSARDTYASIAKRLRDMRNQIDTLRETITHGDGELVELRAQEILSGGRSGTERSETVSAQLMTQRDQLRSLETELRALEVAEKRQANEVERLEEALERQAADRLYADIARVARQQDEKLQEVQKLNDELLVLETQLRKSGLAEVGGKALLMLSRSGIAWNALSPTPINGAPIHFESWRQHLRGILED